MSAPASAKACARCRADKPEPEFSNAQLKRKGKRVCKTCVEKEEEEKKVAQAMAELQQSKAQAQKQQQSTQVAAGAGARARLQAKLLDKNAAAAANGKPHVHNASCKHTHGADGEPPAAAPVDPVQRFAELRTLLHQAMAGGDATFIGKVYLQFFGAAQALSVADPANPKWTDVLLAAAQVLGRFGTLLPSLAGESVLEEERDMYTLYRSAVYLTIVSASIASRKLPQGLRNIQMILQLLWERFGGLGLGGDANAPGNVFLARPVQMLLGTLVDLGLLPQAEMVVESLEQLLELARDPVANKDALEVLPPTLAPSSMPSDLGSDDSRFLLPEWMRRRSLPPSSSTLDFAYSMNLRPRWSGQLLTNLRVSCVRFRAQHALTSEERMKQWVLATNELFRAEQKEMQRTGAYSVDVLTEAAEAAEEANLLPLAAEYIRRVIVFFQPLDASLAKLQSGEAELSPALLIKVPLELSAQLTAIHGSILTKQATLTQLGSKAQEGDSSALASAASASSTPAPSSSSSQAVRPLFDRYAAWYSLLLSRLEAGREGDLWLQALVQQVTPLVECFGRPYDALKKTQLALRTMSESESFQKRAQAGQRSSAETVLLLSLHCLEGWILAEHVEPPQRPRALEAFRKGLQVLREQQARVPMESPPHELERYIRCWVLHLAASTRTDTAAAAAGQLAPDALLQQLTELLSLQQEYLNSFCARLRRAVASRHAASRMPAAAPAYWDVSFALSPLFAQRAKFIMELEEKVEAPGLMAKAAEAWTDRTAPAQNAAAASSAADEAAPKEIRDLQAAQHTYAYGVMLVAALQQAVEGAKLQASSAAAASSATAPSVDLPASIQLLSRIVNASWSLERHELMQRQTAQCVEIHSRLGAHSLCSSPSCRILSAPPTYAFMECAACRVVEYCSRECQKKHWPTHKTQCKEMARQRKQPQAEAAADSAAAAATSSSNGEQKLKAALFDIDGTLSDTDEYHRAIFRELLAKEGMVCDEAFFNARISGRSNAAIVADLLPHLGPEEAAKWSVDKEAMFRERAAKGLKPLAGLVPLLAKLRAKGVRLAAVTNAPKLNAHMILDSLALGPDDDPASHPFELVVLGDECGSPPGSEAKPHPEPYARAMRHFGVQPEQCVVFEDSLTGCQAGRAAGAVTVGILTSQQEMALKKAGAHVAVNSFAELDVDRMISHLSDFVRAPAAQ